MPVKIWQTIVRFWLFLTYLITTVIPLKVEMTTYKQKWKTGQQIQAYEAVLPGIMQPKNNNGLKVIKFMFGMSWRWILPSLTWNFHNRHQFKL